MKSKTATRRAMLLSLTSLLICAAMLIGTTFAWFTDSVTSGTNRIIAGNLDVELDHQTPGASAESVDNATKLFTKDISGNDLLWEPEVIAYETFTVKNVGSLALKYNMTLNNVGYNTLNGHSITEVIKVAIAENAPANREDAKALFGSTTTTLGDLTNAPLTLPDGFGKLLPGQTNNQSFTVVLYWPQSDADNTYNANNGKDTSDGDPLYVNLGITLVATQVEQESDSFNNQYDATATQPADPWAGVAVASKTQTIVANEANTITAPLAPADNKSTTVDFAAGALNAGSATLTVKTEDVEAASAKSFSVVSDTSSAVATIDLSLVINDTQVTTFEDNKTATITTYIAPGLNSATVVYNGDSTKTFGTGVAATVYATDAALVVPTALGTAAYSQETGKLVFVTDHFSQYVVACADEAYDDTAKKGYATLSDVAAAVNAGTANTNSFTLLRDVDMSSVTNWTPIGSSANYFSGSFNGNGHSVKNLSFSSTTPGIGLFGYVGGAAVNAAVDSIADIWNSETYEAVLAPVQETAYATVIKNLKLDHFTLAGTTGDGKYIGTVAGFAQNAYIADVTVSNCTLSSAENGKVGGAVGASAGNMAYVNIAVTGGSIAADSDNNAGGIAGTVQRSVNDGSSNPQHLVVFLNCTNAAAISADNHAGGIVGNAGSNDNLHCAVIGCVNNGTVTGKKGTVGGIVGDAHSKFLLLNDTNNGSVTLTAPVAPARLGGIATTMYWGGWIRGCTNNGTLTGEGAEIGKIFSGISIGNSVKMYALYYNQEAEDEFVAGTGGNIGNLVHIGLEISGSDIQGSEEPDNE